MIRRFLRLKRAGVLGLNARNSAYILPYNRRALYPMVDDKVRCKQALSDHGIAVPELLSVIRTQHGAAHLRGWLETLNAFVIKPANGSGGDGILVIQARRNGLWVTSSGKLLDLYDLQFHVSGIINGLYSLGGQPDTAMFEAIVYPDPAFRLLAPEGVPDIRIIVYRGVPVMAMLRLPTRRSGGKGNLHQGAIGTGIDMATGRTLRAVMDNRVVTTHPDTGQEIAGFQIPGWQGLLHIAARCQSAIGLGYLGVDIVLDRDLGPLVLELNARPGLSIQIANCSGLGRRLAAVDDVLENAGEMTESDRLNWMRLLADAGWTDTGYAQPPNPVAAAGRVSSG